MNVVKWDSMGASFALKGSALTKKSNALRKPKLFENEKDKE